MSADPPDRKRHRSNANTYQIIASRIKEVVNQLETNQQKREDNEKSKNRREKWTIGGLFLTAAIALGTLLNAECNSRQQHSDTLGALQKADEANRISLQGLTAVQRPFVYLDHLGLRDIFDSKTSDVQAWMIEPFWENGGSTRATNLHEDLACIPSYEDIVALKIDQQFSWETYRATQTAAGRPSTNIARVLGPHQISSGTPCEAEPTFISGLSLAKAKLYVVGIATYGDMFDKTSQHVTRFCLVYDIKGNPFKDEPGLVIAKTPCGGRNNCADDECN